MADDTDVLIEFCKEYWEEMRHMENQRSFVTNLVIVIAAAAIGFISQQGIGKESIPLAVLLILLGLYGAVTVGKLYERHQFGQSRLDNWYKRIDELHPNAQFLSTREVADTEHRNRFQFMSQLSLHPLWILLNIVVTMFGVILLVLAI